MKMECSMKKFTKVLILLVSVLMLAGLMTACSENTKQDSVKTNPVNETVSSNGGVAVQYGNYLYFVNGYAGSSAINTFGSVKTGAICRVEMVKKEDKIEYDYNTFEVIVPKNVYGSDTTYPGIYIDNGYVYYHTTSVDKDSKGEYKSDEGVLMRTKVDGTKTEVIKEFDDNTTVFYVAAGKLVYERDDVLTVIDLSSMKETALTSKEKVAKEYKFVGGYVVYTTYNYDNVTNYSSDYLMYVYDLAKGANTVVLSSAITNANESRVKTLYTLTIKDVAETSDGLYVFYSKEDNVDGLYAGYYYLNLAKSNIAAVAKETRLSNETSTTTYTDFYVLKNNGYVLAYNSGTFTVFQNGVRIAKNEYDKNKESAFTTIDGINSVIDVYETDTEVYAYYTVADKKVNDVTCTAFNYIKLFNKVESQYAIACENKVTFFYGVYNSTYTTYEITPVYYYGANGTETHEAIFYLNSNAGDVAHYALIDRTTDVDDFTGKVLGKIDGQKLIDIVSSGEKAE